VRKDIVGVIVENPDVIFLAGRADSPPPFAGRDLTRGIVGIIDHQQPGIVFDVRRPKRNSFSIVQGQRILLETEVFRPVGGRGITGFVGHADEKFLLCRAAG